MRTLNLSDDQLNSRFHDIYREYATDIVFCPYRIAPLGAHIDHQLGKILGLAIDVGTKLAYRPMENTRCEFVSIQYASQFFTETDIDEFVCKFPWSRYCQAAILSLKQKYILDHGMQAVIDGPLPCVGLASSASLILAIIVALARVNHLKLSSKELIDLSHDAETRFLGVMCGELDPACEVLADADKILYLDCLDDSHALVDCHCTTPYKWMVCYSGLSADLSALAYNKRREECKEAAELLLTYAGIQTNTESVTFRAVPDYIYKAFRNRLPDTLQKRADHFYSEMRRVELGLSEWESGDLVRFGEFMTDSGNSSIVNYESGCLQLIELHNILANTDGVYGTRISGAGFRGCCIALIDASRENEVRSVVTQKYISKFPELDGLFFAQCYDSCYGLHEVI